MASDLLSIAKSGAHAARAALDVTAQNIANAASEGYVRRSARLTEVASAGSMQSGDLSLSGVRLAGIVRNADLFRQAEARRTAGDAARAGAEVSGLENIEGAVEQANVYPAIVAFEGALDELAGDPTNPALRAATIESARTLVRGFNIAARGIESAGEGLRFEATDAVSQVNRLASDLARVNLQLSRASDASSDQSALLDQRDNILASLSGHADISTVIGANQTVEVRLGGSGGPQLVVGGTTAQMTMATAADGAVSFAVGGSPVALSSGALAGRAQALDKLADVRTRLDAVAGSVIGLANAAQASGVALDGAPGQPLFGGTTAGDISLALTDGAGIATAPAGAPAGSRNPANLDAFRAAFASADPAAAMDGVLFDISSTVAGRKITRDALQTIAADASVALQAQAGVDLDQEAANLIRFQQAFQASGRVMQVAADLFDVLMAIR